MQNAELKKKKESAKFDGTMFEIIFFFVGTAAINVFLPLVIEKPNAVTYIGTAGLLAARRRLVLYLLIRMARIFAPLLCLLFTGFWVHLLRREKLRPSKERLMIGLMLCLFMYPMTVTHRTGFELQCDVNGYRGIRPVKAIMLLSDIQRDLREQNAPEPETLGLETARENYRYVIHGRRGSRSSRCNVYEYALTDASGNYLAQIAPGDAKNAEGICAYAEHSVALYPHSGFVAAFDGEVSLPQLHDFDSLFTLTYDPETQMLRRTTNPHENEMRFFYMIVERDGEQIGQIGLDNRTEQFFSAGLHTRAWLEMQYEGKQVRVSNIIAI